MLLSTFYAVLLALVLGAGCVSTPTVKSVSEEYRNGKKREYKVKWKIVDGELHTAHEVVGIGVWGINKDGSITQVVAMVDGKREDIQKEGQISYNRIK